MKLGRIALILATANVVLLLLTLNRAWSSQTPEVTQVVRARVLEVVDENGQVRSRLSVEPEGEVVLRLMDPSGTIRVKLGADANGSGLLLLDETTEPAVHMVARRADPSEEPSTTRIVLRGADGRRRVLEP